MNYKVCVLGAGSFGTALAHCAAANKHIKHVQLYARDQNVVNSINQKHTNPKHFSDFELSQQITATNDLQEALNQSSYILSCIPVQMLTSFIKDNKNYFDKKIPFVSCSKGIILETGQLISQMIKQEFDGKMNYACLSGPSFAIELMKKYPTSVVVASENEKTRKLIQLGLSSNFFKIYTQKDVIGVELAGALKNILAIGAGIIEGAGYGYNTTTAFLARGAGEMQRFARMYGADKHTFFGLAGIGDLMLTSFGTLSRNRTFGVRIGKGEKIEDIQKSSKGVVEGMPTLELVIQKAAELQIDMPNIQTIYDFIQNKITIKDAIDRLMLQNLTEEFPPTFEDLIE